MLGVVRRLGFDATDPKVRKILYLHETSLAIVAKCGHPMGHPQTIQNIQFLEQMYCTDR
jgi:hypothetical protein